MKLEQLGEEIKRLQLTKLVQALHDEGLAHVAWVLEAFIEASNEGQKTAINRAIAKYVVGEMGGKNVP